MKNQIHWVREKITSELKVKSAGRAREKVNKGIINISTDNINSNDFLKEMANAICKYADVEINRIKKRENRKNLL